jgi:hypothetical protein
MRNVQQYVYRFPQQLVFGHLNIGERFCFPTKDGVFKKISPRRYIEIEVYFINGTRVKERSIPSAKVQTITTPKIPVVDSLMEKLV